MSAVNAVEVIAEALAEHDGHADKAYDDFYDCPCGWETDIVPYDERKAAHIAHQAAVIAALPNIAILPLPEQDAPNTWSALPGFRNPVELTPLDSYPIRHSGDVITNVEGARYLAARLLAAARAGGES